MKQTQSPIIEVALDDIMPFISRARDEVKFKRIKASIKKHGLKVPIGLRDITHLPAKDRHRPSGGTYKYQLVKGEGRIRAHRELGLPKIKAKVKKMTEAAMVGEFLAENLMREHLPWAEKAKLVKGDLDKGLSHEAVAKKYFLTKNHVLKFERILNKTAAGLEDEIPGMTMNEAEVLTALPAEHQTIVMEALKETGEREIQAIVRKARQVVDSEGTLSKTALTKSIERVTDDLKEIRDKMKVTRLHFSLGPENVENLLKDKKLRNALEAQKVNLKTFEELVAQ